MRNAVVLVAVSLIAAAASSLAQTTPTAPHTYEEMIDLSQSPGGGSEWRFPPRNRMVFLCGGPKGCWIQMKIDGPCGSAGAGEQIQIAADGLAFTSTTKMDPEPEPRVDGDRTNRFLIGAAMGDFPAGRAACFFTDQDDSAEHLDATPGFAMQYVASGNCAGKTACRVVITEGAPRQ